MESLLLVIACLVAAFVVWALFRVGSNVPTAGWAWALVLLFAAVLVAEVVSMRATGTAQKSPFLAAPAPAAEDEEADGE